MNITEETRRVLSNPVGGTGEITGRFSSMTMMIFKSEGMVFRGRAYDIEIHGELINGTWRVANMWVTKSGDRLKPASDKLRSVIYDWARREMPQFAMTSAADRIAAEKRMIQFRLDIKLAEAAQLAKTIEDLQRQIAELG